LLAAAYGFGVEGALKKVLETMRGKGEMAKV
jgi:hypothetical protein